MQKKRVLLFLTFFSATICWGAVEFEAEAEEEEEVDGGANVLDALDLEVVLMPILESRRVAACATEGKGSDASMKMVLRTLENGSLEDENALSLDLERSSPRSFPAVSINCVW